MKKYELLKEDTIKFQGRTLYRIRALHDFSDVHNGDLGGYVESENNLSHEGNAWVYGNAGVYGNARVYGDAGVSGNAKVYGDAWVSGNAGVYGNARVYGNAWVSGNAGVSGNAKVYGDAWVSGGTWEDSPLYIQGTKYVFNISSPGTVRCGCQDHTWQEWHDTFQQIAEEHDAADIVEEYVLYFNLACKRYGHEDCMIDLEASHG